MKKRSTRRKPRQRRSKATVDAILEAVVQIIKLDGAEAVTTNYVAEVAGVSIGTLYQYFSSKRDIYFALHEREFEKLAANVGTALVTAASGTLDDVVIAVVDAVLQSRLSDPELHRLLAHTVPRRRETKAEVARLAGAFNMAVAAHRDELRDDVDLELFVFTLGNLMNGITSVAALGWRPPSITAEMARDESVKAIRAYIDVHRAKKPRAKRQS